MVHSFSLRCLFFVQFLAAVVLSVYVDEAYNIDFHYALLGRPDSAHTFFHQPVKNSKASLLYALSEKSVVAALNPKDGAIVWRQQLFSNSTLGPASLRVGAQSDLLFTAAGSQITAWSAADGRLVWQNDYAPFLVTALAAQKNPEPSSELSDIFISLSGSAETVIKLDGHTGKARWSFREHSSGQPFALLQSTDSVHLISLHSTMLKGLKLKVTTINKIDGSRKDQHTLNTENEIKSRNDVLFIGSSSSDQILVWSDSARKTLKIYRAGSNNFQSFDVSSSNNSPVERINVHTIPHNTPSVDTARFLVSYESANQHWADVFEIESRKSGIRKVYGLAPMAGRSAFSVGILDGKLHYVRLTQDQTILLSSSSETPLATWPTFYNVPGLVDAPMPVHAVTEIAIRSGSSYAVRAAVLVSTGDWVLIRNGETSWSRPEALASITRAEWATLVERESSAEDLEVESSRNLLGNLLHRIMRHIGDLQNLAEIARALQTALLSKLLSPSSISSDAFGFHKLLFVRTDNQRLIALDMGDKGRVVWNINGLLENGNCQSAASIQSQLLCLNKLSPKFAEASGWSRLLHYHDPYLSFDEPVVRTNIDGGVDGSTAPSVYSFHDGALEGYSSHDRKLLWQFHPPPGHHIHSVKAQMSFEPIASIGKALADRSVLYKYLNPNALMVITVEAEKRQAIVSLVDATSGSVLYSSRHENVDPTRPISSIISENKMAFSYTIDSALDSVSKGFVLVAAEFFESTIPDDRGPRGTISNYSALHGRVASVQPHVYSQAYHIPEEITQMVVTQTGQGITSRQLLAGIKSFNSIVAIPPYILDPRRLVGKDPTSAQQYEEGLSRYTPMFAFEPSWFLNHKEEIFGLEKILTTSTMLESTSLVFAYGLDLFGTRVSPSFGFDNLGTEFNKVQLMLTVLGLLAGVFVVAPIIERKQTNALWQMT